VKELKPGRSGKSPASISISGQQGCVCGTGEGTKMSKHFFPPPIKPPGKNPYCGIAGLVERCKGGFNAVVLLGQPMNLSVPISLGRFPTRGTAAREILRCQVENLKIDQAENGDDNDSYTPTKF
jgi:hypothetical protein